MMNHSWPYQDQNWLSLEPVLLSLTREELLWAPDWTTWGVGESVLHMVRAENYWINKVLRAGPSDDLEGIDPGDGSALWEAYRRVRVATLSWLTSLSSADFEREHTFVVGDDGWAPFAPVTVPWVLQHLSGHEGYHCGQIVYLLRMRGLNEPLF